MDLAEVWRIGIQEEISWDKQAMSDHIDHGGEGSSSKFCFVESVRRRIQANGFFQVQALWVESGDYGSDVFIYFVAPARTVGASKA